jgi:hypothetical protein
MRRDGRPGTGEHAVRGLRPVVAAGLSFMSGTVTVSDVRDFEKLGAFYLGRRYDPDTKAVTPDLVLYDSKDLVTHALCVGMTGSGKTGLGIALIEEAAIDGVPVIVIDPKGDLTNLLLTFPRLAAEEFEPWVNARDAERAGKSPSAFAADQAERWKEGLADWGQDAARIRRLREAADFAIYTPGSTAGVPVSVLGSFERPTLDDPELVQERVQTDVSSLLSLAGIEAEPMKSREHILLSTILTRAWEAGESPDLASLVPRVQHPPVSRIGVIDIDSFFPPKDRFALAMAINALLAAPGFEVWTQGEALDAGAFLRTRTGRPRVSIFSIAHLDDSQRMFFVSLLLNAVTGWMRAQSGTTSLRAMVYMDEIFGFFPPVANPPSKLPLLTMLKQGRAVGLGVVLATQNPVDLDYKGLSNIGTWWLGRLQTARDKERVLDGLETASSGGRFDRSEVDRLLSALSSRVFLMRNVHEDGLTVFHSRWALSYLRGPLGRDEIRALVAAGRPAPAANRTPSAAPAPAGATVLSSPGGPRPVLPPDVPQFFAPRGHAAPDVPWRPVLYGAAEVRFVDRKLKVDTTRMVMLAATIADGAVAVDWQDAVPVELAADALEPEPSGGERFEPVPAAASRGKNYEAWARQLAGWIAAHETVEVLRSPSTAEVSRPDESERDFRARLHQTAREVRDRALEALRKKYAPKQAALDERVRRAEQAVAREANQATNQKVQTAISFGATLVGALLGRKAVSAGTVGRATTAARGVGRARKEAEDVERARQTLDAVAEDRQRLEDDLKAEAAALEVTTDAATEALDRIVVPARTRDVHVKVVALVWMPG